MIKVTFTTTACPSWSVARVVDAARQHGYEGVELRRIDGESLIEVALPPHAALLHSWIQG
jgi:hypothetical protein